MAIVRYPHIILTKPPEENPFTSIPARNTGRILSRNARPHHDNLQNKLRQAWENSENEQAVYHTTRQGIYLEFKGEPGFDLVTKSLEDLRWVST